MPVGGGDIGCNVWVEKGDVFCYLSRSGAFDENNALLKLGRIRLKIFPNPFLDTSFQQTLALNKGYIIIKGNADKSNPVSLKIWVDVFKPVIHFELNAQHPVRAEAAYETWRITDHEWTNDDEMKTSRGYSGAPIKAKVKKDSIVQSTQHVIWYHHNSNESLFDITVKQQGLDSIKHQLWNPLKNLAFGGMLWGNNLQFIKKTSGIYSSSAYEGYAFASIKAAKKHHLQVVLHIDSVNTMDEWIVGLNKICKSAITDNANAATKTEDWWKAFWQRSYIYIQSTGADSVQASQVARNYQLFRYQLGCNAYGKWPSKFNGGLFTYDPVYTHSKYTFTPDFRAWGGGTHTAQNQRLLYWPMLKSGDFEMMQPQFDFYLRALGNAEARTKAYWGHEGAAFTEQMEQFGLPAANEWGWKRPMNAARGVEYNNWLEYLWDTSLEFCQMIIEQQQYTGKDVKAYMPLIESCLIFFDKHYQYQARQRGCQPLDGQGKLIIYPGSANETYKMAYNPTPTIAALQKVLSSLLAMPEEYLSAQKRKYFTDFLKRVPNIAFRERNGFTTIAPAWQYARINNIELSQLYPVYPWGLFGVGKPNLDIAINTWKYGADNQNQKGTVSWHQDAIFCARLGLTNEAKSLTIKKLQNAPRRFPTFWGPGHDWVPDHNWGGSGMIGLQEMLLQTNNETMYLFPAWPKEWNVTFKLHAPYKTIVEGTLTNGKLTSLKVLPETRMKDLQIMLK